jgi:hypothetical protein
MNQVHGKNVFVVSKNDDGKTIDDCDGLLTNDQNVTLVVRTADCLPISLIDKKHHAIGLVHAGWRGLHKKIIRNAIGLMVGNFQTEPSDLHIEIGPHICANHYEVGPEVSRFFNNEKYLDLSKIAATFTHGLMKFTLEGIDVTAQASEGAIDKSYGTDKDPMPLKTAINLLCVKHSVKVYFWRPNTKEEWEFGDPNKGGKGDKNYPKGVWRENSQNLIQTIMNWIAPYKTDKDKGVTPSFNSKRPPGSQEELILWEGFAPRCGEIVDPCDPKVTIGTYIVNGSKFSPVISFNPTFNWHFGAINQSGGASSQVSNQQKPEQGIPNCDFGKPDHVQKGNPTFNPVTDDAIRIYGTKRALTATQNSQAEHARANISANSISAELKVQGDPLLADPIFLTGKFCSVIFINPFHIQKTSTCGDWLQAEPCNSMLSNRAWIVLGSYHEIREGSYTTTIKLQLPAPGVDISVGEPLGADPKGGKIN